MHLVKICFDITYSHFNLIYLHRFASCCNCIIFYCALIGCFWIGSSKSRDYLLNRRAISSISLSCLIMLLLVTFLLHFLLKFFLPYIEYEQPHYFLLNSLLTGYGPMGNSALMGLAVWGE